MDEIADRLEPLIPALRRYAWVLVRDREAADDLVQDTLERAITRWHLRRRNGDLRAWLFTIERNLFLSDVRRRKRRGHEVDPGILDDLAAGEAAPDAALASHDVLAGLDALSEDMRSVLVLVAVDDVSYADAARVLGVPVGTVMSRLSRARGRMRQILESGPAAVLRRVK